METDAALLLVLSVYVARDLGLWVLAIGLARYVFLAAKVPLPWLRGQAPARPWCKVVAALQGIALVVAASGLLPGPVAVAMLLVALALLTESFAHEAWDLVAPPATAPDAAVGHPSHRGARVPGGLGRARGARRGGRTLPRRVRPDPGRGPGPRRSGAGPPGPTGRLAGHQRGPPPRPAHAPQAARPRCLGRLRPALRSLGRPGLRRRGRVVPARRPRNGQRLHALRPRGSPDGRGPGPRPVRRPARHPARPRPPAGRRTRRPRPRPRLARLRGHRRPRRARRASRRRDRRRSRRHPLTEVRDRLRERAALAEAIADDEYADAPVSLRWRRCAARTCCWFSSRATGGWRWRPAQHRGGSPATPSTPTASGWRPPGTAPAAPT